MSLYTAADGLLGTHVTWGEVEEEMQKALGTSAKFGDDKTVTNISDMKGFMSRIALVEPKWVGATDEENLPEKFVVKISSQLPFIEVTKLMDLGEEEFWDDAKLAGMGQVTRLLHNREVATYKILMREKHPKIPFTKIYASKPFDDENTLKAYIISEYIPNLHHVGMHENIPAEDLLPIIHAMGAFSAIGQKLSEEETKYARGCDFLDVVFGQFMDEKAVGKTEAMMRKSFPEEHLEKVEKMLKINREYYLNPKMLVNFKNTCEFFGYQPVLTHSDLWSSNFLCTRDGEKVTLKAIIDYQTVSVTTPAQDVGRLFASCLSTKDRREKADFLLEEYYKTFVKELDGMEVPYTLQNLKDSYQVFFPLMSCMVLPGIAPLLEHAHVSEEYRESMKQVALDKMIGLLEDIITTHECSIQKFPKYFEY
uniref:CHK domain-containing protein n=1 Tax=Caenorhabditis tropicalis TaxID=1561998 RepID=A0A1I7TSC2_9PELO